MAETTEVKPAAVDPNATVPHINADGTAVLNPPGAAVVERFYGEYELLEEIARGGMGVVYKARQRGLDRVVALKMILAGQLAGQEEVTRFRVEAQAVARLQHPNIVSVYDWGEHAGRHYFSMEYVPGTSLEQRVAQGALPSREAARYVLEVARALHFAHDKGILHRDLKPANILVDPENRPKLTDFGLAKMLATPQADQAASTSLPKGELTRTGAVMGTPSYMAPEQASGDTKQIGPATDVYGLGAVLYELLTGRPPFKGESQVETILQVLNQDPVPPRLSNPNVDVDLETICLKCLEKDPQLRYASAEALAADLHRYLSDEPITARSVNVLERLTRVLTYSQHDKELKKWGLGLMLFGVIVLFAHTASSFLLAAGQPDTISFWGPRTVEIMLLGLVLWFFRDHALWPTSQAQRLIWATWVGYLVAHFVLSLVLRQFGHPHQHIYALSAALTGMAFCVMGCHVWGGCYVIALAFFVTAPILAMFRESDWSPLWFGVMWSAALVVVGMRYYRLGQVAAAQHQAAPAAPKGG